MSKTTIALVLLTVGALASTQPASAGHTTKTYEATSSVFGGGVILPDGPDPAGVTEDGSRDVGGVVFTPAEYGRRRTVSFRVADLVNPFGKVHLFICQNPDGDRVCGESADGITQMVDEPSTSGCLSGGLGSAGQRLILTGIDRRADISVFVGTVELCRDGSLAGGTSGKVRVFH